MVFDILTDKAIEELQERDIRLAKPVQLPFVRCKDAGVMRGGRGILERPSQVPRESQLLRQFLLPGKRRSRFRNLEGDRPLRSFSKGDRPSLSATHVPERSLLRLCGFDRLTLRSVNACLYRACRDAQGGPLVFHFSPFTNPPPSHCSPIIYHFSQPR